MTNKDYLIIVTVFLLIPALILIMPLKELSPIGSVSAPQPPAIEGDTTFWDGDWFVDSNAVYVNQTIIVNGNLTVLGGFSLTLINVTIRMNNTGNLTTYVHVNNGGTLQIRDYDMDSLTTNDGCNISSNITDGDHRFGFYIHQGSSFIMINSALTDVGHGIGSIEERGLYIHTDNAVIRNCTISRGYRGINVDASVGTIIENCTLTDLDDDGIYIQSTSDSLFYNNTIDLNSSGDYGISFVSGCWRNRVIGNTINVISGNSEGIRLAGGGEWNEIHHNTLNVTGSGSEGIRLYSGYVNITSNTIYSWDPASEGIQLSNGCYFNVIDNKIISSGINICALGIYGVDNVTVKNNNFTMSQDNCRAIAIGFSAHDILIENTTITVTSGINNYGINCDNTYDVMIVNTTILGPQTGIDVDNDAHVVSLNTQFITYDVGDSISDLTAQHYLDLTVENWQGVAMPGAIVQIKNSTGASIFNGPTDANGQIRYLPLTEVVHYESSSTAKTPHNITVTHNGYDPWNTEVTMDQNRNVKATLQPLGVSGALRRGDWWVDTTEEYWNTSFLMDGNITVNATGNLILHNCTIMMNCSLLGSQYRINITTGGELHVFDFDWDNTTTDDTSAITDSPYDVDDGSIADYVFSFYVWAGSTLEIRNSTIFDCGWDAPNFEDKGIYVEADSALFDNVNITSQFIGIIFQDSANSIVENSSIYMTGFSDIALGIRAWNCPGLSIINNLVDVTTTTGDDLGIYVGYCAGAIVQGNQVNIHGTQGWNYGLFLAESSNYYIAYNDILLNAPGAGINIWLMDGCQLVGNDITSYVDYCDAVDLSDVTSSSIEGTTIELNGEGTGIYLAGWLDNTTIENVTITGSADFIYGIFLGTASWIFFSNILIDLTGFGCYGFSAIYSDNISVTDITINLPNADGTGIVFYDGTSYVLFESAQITTLGTYPAYVGINCTYIWFINSTFNSPSAFDIDLSQNASLYLVNVSFSDADITEPLSFLVTMWYLHVQVQDDLGQPFPGVIVRVEEADTTEVRTSTVDGNGWMNWTVCVGYIMAESGMFNSTNPHVARAYNATCWDEVQVDLTSGGQTAIITLANDDPIITDPVSNLQTFEDSIYSIVFHATDREANPLVWSINNTLGWIDFNSSSGNLTITPSNDDVGTYSFTIRVTDVNGGYDEFSFILEVLNRPPEILTTDVDSTLEDTLYSRNYDSDDDPNTFWALESGPAWLIIDTVTGELSGTPDNSYVGMSPVNISVTDNHGGTTYNEFSLWVINTNPTIDTTDVLTAYEDVFYQADYNCSDDGQGTITWGLLTNATWLLIDAQTGLLSGTPSYLDVGEWTVNIYVYDGNGGWDYSNFTLTVENNPPIISFDEIPWADEDNLYYVDFASSDDGEGNITWSCTTNASWLTINSTTGILNGTPLNEHVGLYWVNVTVRDGYEGLGWLNFTVLVNNTNDDPQITTTDVLSAQEDVLYFVLYNALDDDGDTLNWSLDPNIGWLTINSTSGELFGTPTYFDVGNLEITVICEDFHGGSDSHTFTIIVAEVNDAPVITYYLPMEVFPTVEEGMSLAFNISYFDEDGDSLFINWILDGELRRQDVPFWSFEPQFGSAGDHEVVVNVSDGNGASVEYRWIVIVTQANRAPIIEDYEPMNLRPVLNPDENSMIFSVNASDPDNDALTYQWFINGNDTGVRSSTFTFDRSTCGPGTHNLTVQISDDNASTMEQTWTLDVKPVEETEPPSLLPILFLAAVIAIVIAFVAFFLWKRRQSNIEDIFIVTNNGLLLAHRSREFSPDRDSDILSSMLTAVQDFVKDSFKEKSKYGLKRLDFGDSVIHIKHGKYVYMAVVLSGEEPPDFDESLGKTLGKIESQYGEALSEWEGELEKVRGMKDMLDDLLK